MGQLSLKAAKIMEKAPPARRSLFLLSFYFYYKWS